MKLSVSNIAWAKGNTESALALLLKHQIQGIDIAPTLIENDINNINTSKLTKHYKNYNLEIAGMQSLLFSCQPISLFDGKAEQEIILQHLETIFKLAMHLNINPLVFGSPKNRYIRNQNSFKIEDAVSIFKRIGDLAANYNCVICLEPNPVVYNCNFLTNTSDAITFIKKVNHMNIKLNLDISTSIINSENIEKIFLENFDLIEHIHISSPFLKDIFSLKNEHISSILKNYNYKKWVALECNFQNEQSLISLENNIALFKKVYSI